jgi:hypothetical protein
MFSHVMCLVITRHVKMLIDVLFIERLIMNVLQNYIYKTRKYIYVINQGCLTQSLVLSTRQTPCSTQWLL